MGKVKDFVVLYEEFALEFAKYDRRSQEHILKELKKLKKKRKWF